MTALDRLVPNPGLVEIDRVDLAAPPGLVGFYSIDALDNGGVRSAREIHPDLQTLAVGDVIPATPRGSGGFEVLHIDPERALVLGGLFDRAAGRQLLFQAPRPERFWHVTWAFVLEPLDARSTRLTVRVRGAFSPRERRRAWWMRIVHPIMERSQLRHLARRAEGWAGQDENGPPNAPGGQGTRRGDARTGCRSSVGSATDRLVTTSVRR